MHRKIILLLLRRSFWDKQRFKRFDLTTGPVPTTQPSGDLTWPIEDLHLGNNHGTSCNLTNLSFLS